MPARPGWETNRMGYTPTFDSADVVQPVLDRTAATAPAARRATLRFGGLTMDTVTGAVTWRGRSIALSVRERELLAALLRRAGQINPSERLATTLGTSARAVEEGMESLRTALRR